MNRQINITDLIYSGNGKPDYVRINKAEFKYFCPYCNDVKLFKRDSYVGVRRCVGCGISEREFDVKRCNRLELWSKKRRRGKL